jgi:hypothetical protein
MPSERASERVSPVLKNSDSPSFRIECYRFTTSLKIYEGLRRIVGALAAAKPPLHPRRALSSSLIFSL